MDKMFGASTASEREDMEFSMQEMQIKDSMNTFNVVSEKCFSKCVSSFRSRHLDDSEKSCITNCTEKYTAHMARMGQRFQEEQMQLQQQQQQQQQAAAQQQQQQQK